MAKRILLIVGLVIVLLLISGCASTPDDGTGKPPVSERIDAILSIPIEGMEEPETQRCLSNMRVRNFKPLGDRHLLFEGRGGQYWVNTLRTRCYDLRHGTVLSVRSSGMSNQYCDGDRFAVGDWFTWPWYRRWPWSWGTPWQTTGSACVLGKFQPVTEQQVDDIFFELKQN